LKIAVVGLSHGVLLKQLPMSLDADPMFSLSALRHFGIHKSGLSKGKDNNVSYLCVKVISFKDIVHMIWGLMLAGPTRRLDSLGRVLCYSIGFQGQLEGKYFFRRLQRIS
jgi:hypothetical protein